MSFYTIVVLIASIILILCLIVMGLLMQKSKSKFVFPPTSNPCPDNWKVKGNLCLIPSGNVGKITSSNINTFMTDTPGIENIGGNSLDGQTTIDFGNSGWTSNGISVCKKQKWANMYDITWDGISNNNTC